MPRPANAKKSGAIATANASKVRAAVALASKRKTKPSDLQPHLTNVNHVKTPFAANWLREIAPSIGAKAFIEPEYGFVGYVEFKNGKRVLFRNTNFNLNPLGSVEIARDKGYSNFFLRHFGYNVPDGKTFFSEEINRNVRIKRTLEDGWAYAQSLGLPVIVKPNNLSQGALVAKVRNKREYYSVAKKIFKRTGVMLVERFAKGSDYRVVVLDGDVISAYERIHLHVVGDGKSSIANLLLAKQKAFEASGRDTIIDATDFRIAGKLASQGMDFDTIPAAGQRVVLLDNANLSTGGDSADVTKTIHPTFQKLSADVTKAMNLRLCGVDIIAEDITKAVDAQAWPYTIIEINGAPGIDNYASGGEQQLKNVKDLYKRILQALEGDLA